MNLEDLAKKTINELNTQIQDKDLTQTVKSQIELAENEDEFEDKENDEAEIIDLKSYEQQINALIKDEDSFEDEIEILTNSNEEEKTEKENLSFSEELFLKNIRERILVLFEGLKAVKKDELENRLDLTINFLEFLLANIEDKLKK